MKSPRHLLAAEDSLRRAVARARRLAFFTDFDGTLVRLRRRPEAVRLPESVRRRLAALTQRGALVGIVSGRSLGDLRARVGLRGVWYVGAHGFFLLSPSNRSLPLLNRSEKRQIARALGWLERKLANVDGIRLEAKEATVAVHYRSARRSSADTARALVLELLRREPGLRTMPGKKVWEILPRRKVTKWTAVRSILKREGWNRPERSGLAFYVGDDVTDEDVFRQLEGVNVAVGKRRRTAARYYLRSPAEVRQFLEKLTTWLT
jgi:trehalose-phosphatase